MGSADAAQPIRIGVSIALSGRYAPMANMYADGLRLWEKDINAKGGVLGRPVRLLIYDDRSSSQKAREIYQRMLTEERVDFVLGPYSSTIGKEIAPIVEETPFSHSAPECSRCHMGRKAPVCFRHAHFGAALGIGDSDLSRPAGESTK